MSKKKGGRDIKSFIAEVESSREVQRQALVLSSSPALPPVPDYTIDSATAQAFARPLILPSSKWTLTIGFPLTFGGSWDILGGIDTAKVEKLKSAEAHKVMRRAPDLISVITAWRGWKVSPGKNGPELGAVGMSSSWQPKEHITATCTQSSHRAPDYNCQCGIWAFKELDALILALNGYSSIRVFGKVSLWGRVIETENGYRAQYGYPSELWLLDNSLEELGYVYDVPVKTLNPETGSGSQF